MASIEIPIGDDKIHDFLGPRGVEFSVSDAHDGRLGALRERFPAR